MKCYFNVEIKVFISFKNKIYIFYISVNIPFISRNILNVFMVLVNDNVIPVTLMLTLLPAGHDL